MRPLLADSGTEATMGHPCFSAMDGRRLLSGPNAPMHPRPESQDRGHEPQTSFISSKDSMSQPVMVSTAASRTFSLSSGRSPSRGAQPVQWGSARPSSLFRSSFLREPMYTRSSSGSREFLSERASQSSIAALALALGTARSCSSRCSSPSTDPAFALTILFL